ncbi:hypothetical protein JCM16358_06590 [Halanaerocella petrolearia]
MNIVLKSKFIQPKCKDEIWIKQDLWYKYDRINDYDLIVIKGRVGIGKTTSLSHFLKENYEGNIYWYSIKDKNKDKIKFWWSIIESFRFENLEFKEATADLISKLTTGQLKIKKVINRLIDILESKAKKDTILVIDNFQLINTNQSILHTLSYFIEHIPKNIHLVISGRSNVDLPKLSYWKIKKKAMLVQDKDFLLNQGQIETIFLAQYQINISPSEIEEIYEISQGWMLVIDLIATKMQSGSSLEDIISNKENFRLLFKYLKAEFLDVLASDRPNLKEVLLKTSLLKVIKVDICDKLLETNNCKQLLEELVDRTGLIKKNNGSYKYHPILHRCLQKEAKQVYEFNQVYDDLKKICYQFNSFEQLVYYNINNNKEDKIIELVLEQGEHWIRNRKYDLIADCLSHLSDKSFLNYPRLLIYQGDLYFSQLKVHSALESYRQAEDLLTRREELINLWLRMAKLHAWANSNQLFIYLRKIIDYKEQLSLEDRKELSYLKVIAKIIKGELKKTNSLLESYQFKDSIYYELKANLCFMQGDFTEAHNFLEKISNNQLTDYLLYNTILLPIHINLFTGNIYQAQQYIWDRLDVNISLIKSFAKYYLLQTKELLQIGDLDKYKIEYKKLLDQINDCPFAASLYRMELLTVLTFSSAFVGDCKTGINYAKQGLEYIKKRKDNLYKAVFKKGLGLNYCYSGQGQKGVRLLHQARDIFYNMNNKLDLVTTDLLLSLVQYNQGQMTEFKYHIKLTLELAQENNYDYLFLNPTIPGVRDPNTIIPLLTTAQKLGIKEDYIEQLLDKIEVDRVDRHPGYSLKITALGEFKIYRGQEEVGPQEWKRRKAKELFKILLVKKGEFISRDKICRLLWPNKELKIAKRNFYVALSRLNKVLEPNRSKGDDTFFIINDNSSYRLNDSITCFYDVEVFEELIEIGKDTNNESIKINYYKQALKLYQGQFLEQNLYDRWTARERERLDKLFLDAASKLVEYYYQNEEYKVLIELADQILKIDNYFEEAYLYKLKAYIQLGRRDLAIKTYLECENTLKQDLDIQPNSDLKEYYYAMTI